jgi:hypothetical protein
MREQRNVVQWFNHLTRLSIIFLHFRLLTVQYAAACAAVQNVLLSLHAEGIGSKWATGPVVRTPAFRQLVQAAPTDRVAALIMVGGMESTHFCSDRERDRTTARRHRRRSIDGDLLVDLP